MQTQKNWPFPPFAGASRGGRGPREFGHNKKTTKQDLLADGEGGGGLRSGCEGRKIKVCKSLIMWREAGVFTSLKCFSGLTEKASKHFGPAVATLLDTISERNTLSELKLNPDATLLKWNEKMNKDYSKVFFLGQIKEKWTSDPLFLVTVCVYTCGDAVGTWKNVNIWEGRGLYSGAAPVLVFVLNSLRLRAHVSMTNSAFCHLKFPPSINKEG